MIRWVWKPPSCRRRLVALRPGLTLPAESVRQAVALDRVSNGRLLLNVVTGGSTELLEKDGIFLGHRERYEQTAEFLDIFRHPAVGETMTRKRQYLSIKRGKLQFPFVQKPHAPIWFGGSY